MMPDQVALLILRQKQLCRGQKSKDFYAAGIGTLVKRWDKCINVGGEYVEK
jgi:hypothetical protein